MLSPEGCAGRRRRLWRALAEGGEPCDALVVTEPESLTHLAGYAPSPFVFNTVEAAAALVMLPDRAVLIGDNLLQPFLDRSHADEVVALTWYNGRKSAPPRRLALAEAVREHLPRPCRRLGVETRGLGPFEAGASTRLDPVIRALRRVKDPDELDLIRQSARAGDAGHAAALAEIEPGMTELDAFLAVQRAAIEAAGHPVIVYGDFASGPRCETERGGPPTHRVIEKGDLFLLDFSVVIDGYRCDFANTFVVGGPPTRGQQELFEACLAALKEGESALKAGIPARDVDAAVRGHFRSVGLADAFPSHSGHGLGLGHPEPPYLVPEGDEILLAGDVIAVEPGLYVPGVGGMRFERNYLVTPDGHEVLTRHELRLAR